MGWPMVNVAHQPNELLRFNRTVSYFPLCSTSAETVYFSSTTSTGASAIFTFTGDAVSIFGPKSSNGASYIVQLDGGSRQTLSAAYPNYKGQSLLYHASLLGHDKHTLRMSHSSNSGQMLAVDYAQVFAASDAKDTGSSPNPNPIGPGIIAAIVVGTVALLALIVVLLFTIMRRRNKKSSKEGDRAVETSNTPLMAHPNSSHHERHSSAAANAQSPTVRRSLSEDDYQNEWRPSKAGLVLSAVYI